MKVISQQQLIKNIGFFLDKATLQLGQEIVQQLRTKLELDSNHFLEDINHGNSRVWTKDAIETGPDLWRPIALGRHCNTITGREFREILLLSDDWYDINITIWICPVETKFVAVLYKYYTESKVSE